MKQTAHDARGAVQVCRRRGWPKPGTAWGSPGPGQCAIPAWNSPSTGRWSRDGLIHRSMFVSVLSGSSSAFVLPHCRNLTSLTWAPYSRRRPNGKLSSPTHYDVRYEPRPVPRPPLASRLPKPHPASRAHPAYLTEPLLSCFCTHGINVCGRILRHFVQLALSVRPP